MRYAPAILCLLLLALLALCSGCTSVTYYDRAGAKLHVGAFFGDAKIASVESPGIRITGFEARNQEATRRYLNAWTISKLIPLGGEIVNSTEAIATTAIKP